MVDLFSGCGGISLGFCLKGFDLDASVELDGLASLTHAINFYKNAPEQVRALHARPRDITSISPEELVREIHGDAPPEDVFDVVVGGPPCQAFARVGRAKLREVASHPEAFLRDPRHNLYLRYIEYVKTFKPLAILMENVPDVLNHGGHNIAEEVCELLEDLGYNPAYTLLNSAYYGVPQMRERMFLIAYRKELGAPVRFPAPSHWVELPKGYLGSRQVALKTVQPDLFNSSCYYVSAPEPDPKTALPAVTAKDALSDLPPITLHLKGGLRRGARRFTELAEYPSRNGLNTYQRLMRNWPGLENETGIYDHVIRSLPRDYDIFRRMRPGDQYPEAYRHALDLLEERLAGMAREGKEVRKGSTEYENLKSQIVPPYDAGKFPNKWRKMEPDLPARTLMAHLGKDGYSHIHYDSKQARTISVREAARLQSFPDGFTFCGTMNPAFRQIGNAVPPLMAAALAGTLLDTLRKL